ncbi:glycoprotein-N-acetylgalactosamine 3-beta-galactosyltransferase 1 isoform X2 [Drosophila gunungcola]|uniref:glycoprotein-N-acetylgalactosamine 3-beta-galactosyltransferase 1 isoform X2 n=1 Tax=Drosophila gunungcola TaxID=103775 RepID=UPI0022E2B27B|nr:glycoprotein-N-acetylgalactosamine 3-beta-galactosyltransferase 1 isoform X2 [Drosophila gunungcola]
MFEGYDSQKEKSIEMIGLRPHRKRLELFLMVLIGVAWGILLSELMRRSHWRNHKDLVRVKSSPFPTSRRISPYSTAPSTTSTSTSTYTTTTTTSSSPNVLASNLFNETRVLCMVLTSPKTHHSKAIHIQRTWGTRCNKLIFMSSKADKELGTVVLKVREGYSNLWPKTRASLQYVYNHHFRNYDWFLKADDDTYVIMENLRAFLYAYSPSSPVYFGNKFRSNVKEEYMSGGAGYVLSKMALHQLINEGFVNSSICSNRGYGYEDIELGRCLRGVGVVGGDSRDEQGLNRFIPFSPLHWYPDAPKWYRPLLYYTTSNITSDCCSNSAISFHYNNAKEFYVLEYVIYKLRAFGIYRIQDHLPARKSTYSNIETKQIAVNNIVVEKNVTEPKAIIQNLSL